MANKITVTISGTDYTLMSEDSPSYMQKVAGLVDEKMTDIMTRQCWPPPIWLTSSSSSRPPRKISAASSRAIWTRPTRPRRSWANASGSC